jgi:hypothetical protein
MKKIVPERKGGYRAGELRNGVRGKFYAAYRAGPHLVRLEPDIAAAFPTEAAVNEALRALIRAAKPLAAARRPRRAA